MGPDLAKAKTTLTATQLIWANRATFRVASTTTISESLLDQMLHGSAQVPAAEWTGGVVGSTLDSTKCNVCHYNLPTKYAGSSFHANAAPAGPQAAANLSSCAECHKNTAPANIVGTPTTPLDHSATLSGGALLNIDCVACHVKTSAGSVGGFTGAGFHAKVGSQSPTSCTLCHYVTEPSGSFAFAGKSALTAGFRHSSTFAPGDCVTCHAMTNANIVSLITANGAVSTNFAGGLFHQHVTSASITSCVDCHIKPATNPSVSNVDSQHMSHASTSVPADCYSCHKSDLVQGVKPTAWNKSTPFHSGTNTTMTTGGTTLTSCKECHGLTNGGGATAGTNNDLPTGLSPSMTLSTYPAGNATLYDQIDHRAPSVAGVDCNVCHTNIGPTGQKWKSASFHLHVTVDGSTTACETCHSNLLPTGTANGENHASGHATCGGCHSNPAGTGVIGSSSNPPNWLGAGAPATITLQPPSGSGWGTTTMPHPTTTGGVTCAQCHGSASNGNLIYGWDHTRAPVANNGLSYCIYCHYQNQVIVPQSTGIVTKGRHEGTPTPTQGCDASKCHVPGFHGFTLPNGFSGGRWHD